MALRGGERLKADSLEKRYINVLGAPSGDERIDTLMRELAWAGFRGEDRVAVVPSPAFTRIRVRAVHDTLVKRYSY